ncbi:MAG: hypothetical protein QOH06_1732 [Acidobacteriota bacterium]|jgi:hypothetical protein|nr:hypothetical protein [Acidobacteriota bacterium]
MEPYATLSIFLAPGETDVAHVSSVLGLEPDRGPVSVWMLSTEGHVPLRSVQEHVRWLLDRLVGRYAELAQLREERYWACVIFHDTEPPDPAEAARVDSELEQHDITFDFELEREDFEDEKER